MELSLIPIVAVLLWLSGAATAARSGGEGLSTTALMGRWFRADSCDVSQRAASPSSSGRGLLSVDAAMACRAAHTAVASRTAIRAAKYKKVRFHTRFGVASVTYRSAAPPLA